MSQQQLLITTARILNTSSIPFMISGSFVSSLQGEPRLTHDIDFVIQINKDQVPSILESFRAPEFYLSQTAIYEAIEFRSMFNVIEVSEGDKVDFWILTEDLYDLERFKRRKQMSLFDEVMFVSTTEDTILKKLHWSLLCGGSQKQESDARHVYFHNKNSLDKAYLQTWSHYLGVSELLTKIMK